MGGGFFFFNTFLMEFTRVYIGFSFRTVKSKKKNETIVKSKSLEKASTRMMLLKRIYTIV